MPTLELEPPLEPCRSYSFLYPNNDSLERRRLLVIQITDENDGRLLEAEWLVTGRDLERQAEESFRFRVMQDVVPIAHQRHCE